MPMAEINEMSDPAVIHELIKKTVETEKEEVEKTTRLNISSKLVLKCLDENEAGDAEIFVQLRRNKFVYDVSADQWYIWAGHSWQLDALGQHYSDISAVIDVYGDEANRQSSKATEIARTDVDKANAIQAIVDKLHKRMFDLNTDRRKKSVLNQARHGLGSLAITGEEWDASPTFLACKNGVVDLSTGKIRDGKPDDYIKTACPHNWEGLHKLSPTWEQSIKTMFVKEEDTSEEDEELPPYINRLLGYAIAGDPVEHIFPVLWGEGRNGKGTLIETLNYVLGDVAHKTEAELLLQQTFTRQAGMPNSAVIALRGKRVVWASETEEGRRLDVSKLKELSGDMVLTARPLYGKLDVNFKKTHLLFLITNHKPQAPPGDEALWDRIHIIPFHLKFTDKPEEKHHRKKDIYLPKKLREEASGILAYLVRGCLEWKKHGLNPPKAVVDATKEYRDGEDILGYFENACCDKNPNYEVKASDLYSKYQEWCGSMGHKPMSGTRFGKDMKRRHKSKKDGGFIYYVGLALKPNI